MVEFDEKMYDKFATPRRRPWLVQLAYNLKMKDRAVLGGLLLSLIPVPPLSLLAIIIAISNLWRLGLGRLDASTGGLVRISLVLSFASLALGIVLTALLVQD